MDFHVHSGTALQELCMTHGVPWLVNVEILPTLGVELSSLVSLPCRGSVEGIWTLALARDIGQVTLSISSSQHGGGGFGLILEIWGYLSDLGALGKLKIRRD